MDLIFRVRRWPKSTSAVERSQHVLIDFANFQSLPCGGPIAFW